MKYRLVSSSATNSQLAGYALEQLSQPGSQNFVPELIAASPHSTLLLWLCLLIYCSGRGILDMNTYAAINWQGHKTSEPASKWLDLSQ